MKPRERLRLIATEGGYINNNFNHDRHYSRTGYKNIDEDDNGYSSYIPIMTILQKGSWKSEDPENKQVLYNLIVRIK